MELESITKRNEETLKKERKKLSEKDRLKIRASMTDPEATKMKMPNSGYNLAYNVQFATDVSSKVIVGLDVVKSASDSGLMTPMYNQVSDRLKIIPKRWLADGGYRSFNDIEEMKKINPEIEVIVPVKNSQNPESFKPKDTDSEEIKEWRINMGTIEAKDIYGERAATSELINAQARNRGLQQFAVRSLEKVTSTIFIFAITHNMVAAWRMFA